MTTHRKGINFADWNSVNTASLAAASYSNSKETKNLKWNEGLLIEVVHTSLLWA